MRILIVEDEKKIADSLKRGLEQENFTVDVAYEGIYGHDLASTEDFDLIILDLMLPGIDGLEICRELRKAGNNTPILMLTARGDLENKVTGLNSGADDYLAKPFAFEELLARIKALTRRPKQILPSILTVGDLSINSDTFEVNRAGKEISLSKKEFSLLSFLIRNKNQVVSKGQIISKVWDFESNILPNTVEVYIGYLRDKIEKPFNTPTLIKTVRGFGYKILGGKRVNV